MKKTNVQSVKTNNKALILNCLRNTDASRAQIVAETGLSKAAVTKIVNEFIENGEIIEVGLNANGEVGRPSVALQLVKNFRYAVGISLHRKTLSISLVNLKNEIVSSYSVQTSSFSLPEKAIDCLLGELDNILIKENISKELIIGIGISCPGPLDYINGVIFTPPNFELFHNFKIKEYIYGKTNLPVFLDNNSVLLALSENAISPTLSKNSMFIVVSDGIGSAVINDGKIFRGSYGYSGELGHISVVPGGRKCPCSNSGCLEQYISMSTLKKDFDFTDYKNVVDLFLDGDEISKKIIDYIVKHLSTAIINAVNLMDIDEVILFGEFNYKCSKLIAELKENINKHSVISNAHIIEVRPSVLDEKSNYTCSAVAILKAYFEKRL